MSALLLADQLKMTDGTWAALREQGVSEGEWRSVDYSFDAPDEQRARSLKALFCCRALRPIFIVVGQAC